MLFAVDPFKYDDALSFKIVFDIVRENKYAHTTPFWIHLNMPSSTTRIKKIFYDNIRYVIAILSSRLNRSYYSSLSKEALI